MNDKKTLMDYRRAQKLQTPLLLTGALLSGVGTSVSVPLVILGIAIMLFAIVIGVLYYRCPHCGRPLGRIGEGGAYCPHCGKALNAPVEEPVRSITVPAYAKLNLTLDILGKRDDGYHEMQMVMQTVSLHDDVTVTLTDGKGITCRVDGAALPCDERNLAVKAARAFCEAMDYGGGIDIALIKRIPSEAGMAGGSADAAGVLVGLNVLYGAKLSMSELCALGAKIGADVPFALMGGTCRVQGVGDVMKALPPCPDCWFTVVMPDYGVSTPEAFAAYDKVGSSTHPDCEAQEKAIRAEDLAGVCAAAGNALEECSGARDNEAIKTALKENGAVTALMTGSGAAVFGVFRTEAEAKAAADALRARWPQVYTAQPVRGGACPLRHLR